MMSLSIGCQLKRPTFMMIRQVSKTTPSHPTTRTWSSSLTSNLIRFSMSRCNHKVQPSVEKPAMAPGTPVQNQKARSRRLSELGLMLGRGVAIRICQHFRISMRSSIIWMRRRIRASLLLRKISVQGAAISLVIRLIRRCKRLTCSLIRHFPKPSWRASKVDRVRWELLGHQI